MNTFSSVKGRLKRHYCIPSVLLYVCFRFSGLGFHIHRRPNIHGYGAFRNAFSLVVDGFGWNDQEDMASSISIDTIRRKMSAVSLKIENYDILVGNIEEKPKNGLKLYR